MILLGGSAVELQQRTQQLQGWSEQRLLVCADVEEGVGQRFEGASWLVPPLALGRLHQQRPRAGPWHLSERYGRCTGAQARRCGLNWVLGPVCDVNNNPANPVINVRAWGEDPNTASALAVAFQQRAEASGCSRMRQALSRPRRHQQRLPYGPAGAAPQPRTAGADRTAALSRRHCRRCGERDDGPSGAAGNWIRSSPPPSPRPCSPICCGARWGSTGWW